MYLVNRFQFFTMAAPRSVELYQNVFLSVVNHVLKALRNNSLHHSLLLRYGL